MKVVIETKKRYVDTIKIDCSPAEWLIISNALKQLIDDPNNHANERRKAGEMLATEPEFKEATHESAN